MKVAAQTDAPIRPCVCAWFEESATQDASPSTVFCLCSTGHVRSAFVTAFRFLRRARCYPYSDAVDRALCEGGDAQGVVGCVMGAVHGLHAVPWDMWIPVASFDGYRAGGMARPSKYQATHMFKWAALLMARAVGAAAASEKKEATGKK